MTRHWGAPVAWSPAPPPAEARSEMMTAGLAGAAPMDRLAKAAVVATVRVGPAAAGVPALRRRRRGAAEEDGEEEAEEAARWRPARPG